MSGVASALLLLWSAFTFVNYWPPFRFAPWQAWQAFTPQGLPVALPDAWAALLGHAHRAVIAVLVIFAARGMGKRFRLLMNARREPWLAAFPFGVVLLGLVGLGFGLTGLVYAPILWPTAVACFLAGGRPGDLRVIPVGTSWTIRVVLVVLFLPAFAGALAPEVTYDALAYHVGAPALYVSLHKIVRLDHMMFTDFPLTVQMSYLFAAGLGGGPGAARLVHWLLGIACVGAAARVAWSFGGRHAAAWAAVLLAATPFVTTQMMKANVDLGVMLLTAAGAAWLLRARSARAAALAGLCLGGAADIKLTGGLGVAAGGVVMLMCARWLPAYALGAAAAMAPWMIKNYLLCGDPVYPFLNGWFHGPGWTAENDAMYRLDMTGPTSFNLQYPHGVDRLAGIWQMIMHDRGGEAAFGPYALAILPSLLLFAPGVRAAAGRLGVGSVPVAVLPRMASVLNRLAVFVGVYWILWVLAARDPRFFLPAWPAVCALTAAALGRIPGRPGLLVRWGCAAGFFFTPGFTAAVAYRTMNPGPVIWGAIPRGFYEARLIPPADRLVPLLRAVNDALPDARAVLVVGDVKAPGLRARPLYPSMFDTPHLTAWLRESASAGRLAVKFRQAHADAVVFNPGGAVYLRAQFGHFTWTDRERRVLGAFWERRLVPVREMIDGGRLEVGGYRVLRAAGARRPLTLPGDERANAAPHGGRD